MKANKIARNVLKHSINILAIISVLIIILQLKQSEKDNKLSIQEVTQQVATEETIETKKEIQVTSRHSTIRAKKYEKIEQKEVIENVVIETTKIEDVTISKDMDLTKRTGLSKENFKTLISKVKHDTSKFFFDNSDYIYDLCEEYEINEIFFCGLISAESGWNIASNHRRTHNYISLMNKNGLIKYNSVEDGLIAAAKALHNNYLTEGGRFYHGKTLYGVKTKFCPASSTWVELVYGRMQQIMNSR